MLGVYDNFPATIHRIADFSITVPSKRLQRTLLETLQKLNSETLDLSIVADPSVPQCTVNFEFGIADASDFDYLNSEETEKILKAIHVKPFETMDFLCAVRYYRTQKEKKTPLRFDYYMIRFSFSENPIRMQIAHERGPRYMTPEDLMNLVVNKTDETAGKKVLKAFNDF
jgi:hypothetical protein